jgi:hypothetical protein
MIRNLHSHSSSAVRHELTADSWQLPDTTAGSCLTLTTPLKMLLFIHLSPKQLTYLLLSQKQLLLRLLSQKQLRFPF